MGHDPASLDASPDRPSGGTPAVDDRAPEPIEPAHRAATAAGLADMRAGRIASAAEIGAVYAGFGRATR